MHGTNRIFDRLTIGQSTSQREIYPTTSGVPAVCARYSFLALSRETVPSSEILEITHHD